MAVRLISDSACDISQSEAKGYIDNSRALWEGHLRSLPVTMNGSTISTHAGPGAIAVSFFADRQGTQA